MWLFSNLKPYSMGRVVENKSREDGFMIKVTPFEVIPHQSEEINADTRTRSKKGVDHTGQIYSATVTEQSWLPAEWIGATYIEKAPDVAVGEQVIIYRSGDSDRFFWDSLGRDDANRKQEDYVMSWSAKKAYDPKAPVAKDESNSYRLRVNSYTDSQYIELSTSIDNGEHTTYNLKFDLKNGKVDLIDGFGNNIFLDSANTHIRLHNIDDSNVDLIKKQIKINAVDLIALSAKQITMNCTTMSIDANSFTLNASDATIKGGKLTIESDTKFMQYCEWEIPLVGTKFKEITPGNK